MLDDWWLLDEVFVQLFLFQSVLLSERKAFAVSLNLHFINFDFVEWKYLLLFLVALSLHLSLCVCLLCDLDYFFQFTICTRLNWLFLPFAGFVLFRAFWFKSRVFRFLENLVIKNTSNMPCRLPLWYSTITSSGHLFYIHCFEESPYVSYTILIYNTW